VFSIELVKSDFGLVSTEYAMIFITKIYVDIVTKRNFLF
jgi:hypothetical protein